MAHIYIFTVTVGNPVPAWSRFVLSRCTTFHA